MLSPRIQGQHHRAAAHRNIGNRSCRIAARHREIPRRRGRAPVKRLVVGQRQRRPVDNCPAGCGQFRLDRVHLVARVGPQPVMLQHRVMTCNVADRAARQAVGLNAHSVRVAFNVSHFVGKDQRRCSRAAFIGRRSPPFPQLQPQLRPPRHLHRLAEGRRHPDRILRHVSPVRTRIRADLHPAHRRRCRVCTDYM